MLEDVFIFKKIKNMKEKMFHPAKQKCFPKCILFLTGTPSYEDYIDFSKNFSGTRAVETEAKFEGFCKKVGIVIKKLNGKEKLPKFCTEKKLLSSLKISFLCKKKKQGVSS